MNYKLAARKTGSGLKLSALSREERTDSEGNTMREEQLELAISFLDLANNIGGRGLDILLLGETRQEIHISSLYLLAMMQSI